MPEVSRFFGMVIAMFFDDHPPPHFHVVHGDERAQVRIDPPGLINGTLCLLSTPSARHRPRHPAA